MKNKALKRLICSSALLMLFFTLCSFRFDKIVGADSSVATGFKFKTIMIDAGHGGRAAGASGVYSLEKNVTLQLALKLQKALELELKDVNVLMTRTTDVFVDNGYRAVMANDAKANLYISLHCNALPDIRRLVNGRMVSVKNHSGRGVLLLINRFGRINEQVAAIAATRENEFAEQEEKYSKKQVFKSLDPTEAVILNAFKDKYRKQSVHFANLVNDEFVNTDGRRTLGVIEQGVQVLANTAMPSVLVETGFIDNPEEEEYLNSEAGQNEIVASIVRAVKQYKKEVEQTVAN